MTGTVSIEVGFAGPPSDPPAFPGTDGGLRIVADGICLTGAANAAEFGSYYEHYDSRGERVEHPDLEYAGEYVGLQTIEGALEPFLEDTADRYCEYEAELMAAPGEVAIVFSRLDDDRIRIAAKPSRPDTVREFSEEAMLGAAVELGAVAAALADGYRQCVDFVQRAYDRSTFGEEIDEFVQTRRERIERLERGESP